MLAVLPHSHVFVSYHVLVDLNLLPGMIRAQESYRWTGWPARTLKGGYVPLNHQVVPSGGKLGYIHRCRAARSIAGL